MDQQTLLDLKDLFYKVEKCEINRKTGRVEIVGYLKVNPDQRVLFTVNSQPIEDYEEYGEHGKFYESTRKRKIRDHETGKWIYVDEVIQRYRLSPGDKKFIYDMYVYSHLDGAQINLLSGIPQPYIYRYIKHKKLERKYENIPRKDRKYSIDFDEPFEIDPYPSRSEWKARREELGLKNGENWRNTPLDKNPGEKIYGSGKTSAKKKLNKLKRKEERKKKNIRKFNSHQNNRYGITKDNPNGTKDPYKQYRETLERKKNGN